MDAFPARLSSVDLASKGKAALQPLRLCSPRPRAMRPPAKLVDSAKPWRVSVDRGLEGVPSLSRSSGHLGGQLDGRFFTPRPWDGMHAVACQRLKHGFRHPPSSIVQDRVGA